MIATAWQHIIIMTVEHAKHNPQNYSSPQGVPGHLHRVQPKGTMPPCRQDKLTWDDYGEPIR